MKNEDKDYKAFLEWKAQQNKKVRKEVKKFDVSNITPTELKKAGEKLKEVLTFVNQKQKSDWTLKGSKGFIKELDGKKYLAVTIARTVPTAEERTSVYAGIPRTWKSSWRIEGIKQPIDRVTL